MNRILRLILIAAFLASPCLGQVLVTNQPSFVTNTPIGSPQGWPPSETVGWRANDKSYCYNLQTNNYAVVMATGNLTSGSHIITGLSTVHGPAFTIGQTLHDYSGDIPGGTTITALSPLTMSNAASGTQNGDQLTTFPYGSITFSVVPILGQGLPPGLQVESLNSNNNANHQQGAITDSQDPGSVGCLANVNPYAGVSGPPALYNFTLKALDNISGLSSCSTSTPWLFTGLGGDCSGGSPMQINVISGAPPAPTPTPVQTFIDTTYSPPSGQTIVVGCPSSPAPAGCELQDAFDNAHPGDTIVLEHGCSYNNKDAVQNCGGTCGHSTCTPNQGFQAPPKTNHAPYQWIYVIPDDYTAFNAVVPQGTRVAPGNASLMPQIVDGIGADALELGREVGGPPYPTYPTCNDMGTCSNYWRFTGIEFTGVYAGTPANPCPGRNANTGRKVNCASSVLLLPQHNKLGQPIGTNNITCDRCYIHGSPNYDVAIGFDMDIIAAALVDSYVVDIHLGTNIGHRGDGSGNGLNENQAAIPEYTPGPIKVVNNRLASTGESFFAGGSGAIYYGSPLTFYDNPYVVRDLDVENNESGQLPEWESCGDGGTVFPGNYNSSGVLCPAIAWASTCTAPSSTCIPGNQWETKNAMEFKSAQRVLVQGNIIENSWPSGQQGSCLLIETAAGESGNSTVVQDITIQNNIIRHCSQTVAVSGQDYNCEFQVGQYPMCDTMPRAQRISWINNLALVTANPSTAAILTGFFFAGNDSEMAFNHNTVLKEDGTLPPFSFYFGDDGFNCQPSPTCNNFAHSHLTFTNNYWGGDPNGGGGLFPYYNMANFGWYMPSPSDGASDRYINPAGFTGNVLTVPLGNTCGLGGLPGGPYADCRWGWNSNPNLPNNAAVFPSGTVLGPCSNGVGGPSYGNFQLTTPNWAGSTTDGQQAGVVCAQLCATGVCGGAVSLSITTTNPPAGTVGVAYSFQEQAVGGAGPPFTWSISAGALPPGLSMSSSGLISGTPTTSSGSPFSFTVKVVDSASNMATAPESIVVGIAGAPVITTTSPPLGAVNSSYRYQEMASGGVPPYTWSISAGNLPPGLSITPGSGLISGTPTTTTGSPFSFTVKVTDSVSGSATSNQSITINPALVVTSISPPGGTIGTPYSYMLTASGGVPPYAWSISSGSLPAGLRLIGNLIAGTPTTNGSSSFTVKATDSSLNTATANLSITIGNAPTLIITSTSPPSGTVGVAYSYSLTAAGGTPPYSWSISAGNLPVGLSIVGSAIQGTPMAAGTVSFTLKVTDSLLATATANLSITIQAPLVVTSTSPPAGTVGVGYSYTLTVSGGVPPYTWSITAGSLPPGLNLVGNFISGTPTTAGTSSFTVQVTDSLLNTGSANLSIVINEAPPVITTTSCPGGFLRLPYSCALNATGGTPPYTWSKLLGSLPPGLTINGSGTAWFLSGTPTALGTSAFTLQVTDSLGVRSLGQNYSVTITPSANSAGSAGQFKGLAY